MRLDRLARLVAVSVRAETRNPGIRLVATLGAAGCLIIGVFWEGHPSIFGLVIHSGWGRLCASAACIWFAYAAVRDLTHDLGPAIRPKPSGGALWVTSHLVSGLIVWSGIGLLGALAGGLGTLKSGGAALWPCLLAYGRILPVLLTMGTLAYGASRLTRSPIGGILVTFAWFCTAAGAQFIPEFLRPEYLQNLAIFAGSAATLVPFLLWTENLRRQDRQNTGPLLVSFVLLLGATIAGARQVLAHSPARLMREGTGWSEMSGQDLVVGTRLPGFQLPEIVTGRERRTSEFTGRILLLYVFSAGDRESVRVLPALDAVAREFRERGVQPIAVCLSPDLGEGWQLALSGRFGFPILRDPTNAIVSPSPDGAVAAAYRIESLPRLLITDRHRRLQVDSVSASPDIASLRRLVEERLRAEPR